MGLKPSHSNPFVGAIWVVLCYVAAAVLWFFLVPSVVGDEPGAHSLDRTLQLSGDVIILLFGAHHLILRTLLNHKHNAHHLGTTDKLDMLFQHFIDEVPANVAIVSKDGRYKYWSQAFQKNVLPELTAEAISAIDLFAEDYVALQLDGHPFPDEERPLIKALNSGEKVTNVTMGLPAGNNVWSWVGSTITPRKGPDGELIDFICSFQLISDVQAAETNLTIQTFQDRLTGLPNRAFFTELVSRAIFMMEKRNSRIGVLFLDLNRFKVLNDTLGHQVGDKLLVQVAKRIRSAIRPGDTIARLGGDEFAILFEELDDLSEAVFVSDWIKNTFEDPFLLDGEECYMGCSQGLAVSNRPDMAPTELIRDAEVAMYRAKTKGADILEIYDQSMNEQTRERLRIESEMRHALHRNEFLVYYQPLVTLATGKIGGWEALVRWKHPERGLVPPIEFIHVAEETGLIMPIGSWVLEEACRQAKEWQKKFPSYSESIMNVNLSMRQFQQQNLTERVLGVLSKQELEPQYLKLEITESATMKDAATSFGIMTALRDSKIHLAIDDFGTDYSSLSYLKRLPVDTLKIDKSFIDGLGLDTESTAIVQAIISLAKALDLRVTAEGIENSDQLAHLRRLGCDIGQGYHFSRPLPSQDAEKLLEQDITW
ncbi:MAG: EAL domain-containing protein [Holophagaceae bacterium]|nr:EAL domain-containing protein [Holophagaceae bacterium]